jgi:transposase InsO family protein
MAAENCPFKVEPRSESDSDTRRKDRFVSFDVPLDPAEPDGLKATHEFRRLDNTEPEDVLTFCETIAQAVITLDLDEGEPRFRLVQALLAGDPAKQWIVITNDEQNRDQDAFASCLEKLTLVYMDRDISLDTKEWLQQIKKPRQMTVQAFLARIRHINDLIEHMPLPLEGANEDDRVPKFSDSELSVILRNSCPRAWRDAQITANLKYLSLSAQANYYSSLRKLEDNKSGNNNNNQRNDRNDRNRNGKTNNRNNNNRSNRNNNNGNRNNGNNGNNRNNNGKNKKFCSIHGHCNHATSECDIIKREKGAYDDKKNDTNNRDHNRGRNTHNNNSNNYNRNRPNNHRNEENNHIQHHNSSRGNQSNSRRGSNHTHPDSDDEINHIDEVYAISEHKTEMLDNKCTSTETKVQVKSKSNQTHMLLGLLDTGASATYVSASALKKIDHTIEPINVQLRGRYSMVKATQMATFTVQLPDFCNSKTISLRAYVENSPVGVHDIVMGTRVCQQLGLIFDFKRQVVHWDELSMTMKQRGTITKETLNSIDDDQQLPAFMQQATQRLTKGISANTYNKHDYQEMVLQCRHLTTDQQDTLIALFKKHHELFSGKLGLIPGPPVHLKLKPNAKPYYAKAYNIPHSIYDIARQEVNELERIQVLKSNTYSPWGAPCLFRGKKDGGVRFITDLRRLNQCLEREPFPLPLIDETLWKIQGFTFATCFDLNRGYYHFPLDEPSQKLCGLVLPWGHYVYCRLPQGLMISSDIFQRRMTQLFGHMEDIIVYIDNIILFTKQSFHHHVQRIAMVLQILSTNNLHVHVEKTFLASQSVDYLGYTLTTKGIMPQHKKIVAILALAPPSNHKQLRSFLGFVNYYKKLWYHRSATLAPLTAISSPKTKFTWGPQQQTAFETIRNTIARQVLLYYPNFQKPFDIYTDASNDQIGGVIVQDNHPIAFYSRKLTLSQRNYTTMEKELLSIVETAEQHRNILLGFECRFYSDHKNLSFEHFTSERVRRWRLLLEEYHYTFHYIPGKSNVIADMLSRYPMLPVTTDKIEMVNVLEDEQDFPINFETIHQAQTRDRNLQRKRDNEHYSTKNVAGYELIHYKDRIVITEAIFQRILQWYHTNLNHPGEQRTYLSLKSHFFTPNMEAKTIEYVKNCPICKQYKRPTKKYGIIPLQVQDYQPWQICQVDLFGPWTFRDSNGNEHKLQALSIIDIATRWPEIVPYDSKRSEDIAMLFDRTWLARYPRPEAVIFDNGPEFSAEFTELLRTYGIRPKPTTVKNPQANAFIERSHQVMANALRTMQLSQRTVDEHTFASLCSNVAFGMRATYHTELQASPSQIVYGRDMIINATYIADWRAISNRRNVSSRINNARENANRLPFQYEIGQQVYIRVNDISRKLDSQQGPFRISQVHANGTVTIQRSPIVTERINIRRLHPA